MAKSY